MPEELLKELVSKALAASECRVSFAFQGGEPLLAGLEFYRHFIELEKEYDPGNIVIEHSIQTNGTLIDEEWASFFKENDFLVGVSIDGTEDLHDSWRKNISGSGSFKDAVRGYQLLRRCGVEANVLCVVTKQASRRAADIYSSLKAIGAGYMQFIPCLDPPGRRGEMAYSLLPEDHALFFSELFDLWFEDYSKGRYVSIRTFDDYAHLLSGQQAGSCSASGRCGQYLAVESDGSVYPCDFYAEDRFLLGNIKTESIDQLYGKLWLSEFISKSLKRPSECSECAFFSACRGGCARDMVVSGGGPSNYYCQAFKQFFSKAFPRLMFIASNEALALADMDTCSQR